MWDEELTDSASFQFRTWTTRDLAQVAERSRWTVHRAVARLVRHLDPPRYRRNGRNWRKHRVYTDREAQLILESILKIPIAITYLEKPVK